MCLCVLCGSCICVIALLDSSAALLQCHPRSIVVLQALPLVPLLAVPPLPHPPPLQLPALLLSLQCLLPCLDG